MTKPRVQQALRDLNQRVARGEVPAAAAVRLAAVYELQAIAVYRPALDVLARQG